MGGMRLKKAEELLIAAQWNLLKSTDEDNKSRATEESLVSKEEQEEYRAMLNKTFGKLFMAQNRDDCWDKALDKLTQGIYMDSVKYGPESIELCSSYFLMG